MKVAIEASNIRVGGGITHLMECLAAVDVERCGVESVTVFAGAETLDSLGNRPWLRKIKSGKLLGGSSASFWWPNSLFDNTLRSSTDILLVPGGSYLGSFRPFVTMAQNLLPFDSIEQRREGYKFKRLRLLLLERVQGSTFRRADGLIYMSSISKEQIERRLGFKAKRSLVVYHGTSSRFVRPYNLRIGPSSVSAGRPFRLLYVSILEPYKHQRTVITAVALARARGLAVTLDLVGPSARGEAKDVGQHIVNSGVPPDCIRYHGAVNYERLEEIYSMADGFVFASSCETFGIILLEAMAGGLPLLCSHRSAMPEVAGSAAIFFDPLSSDSLADAIAKLYGDSLLQRSLSFQGRQQAAKFSWEACADQTFGFLRKIYHEFKFGVNS